jgi:hypothetical protein
MDIWLHLKEKRDLFPSFHFSGNLVTAQGMVCGNEKNKRLWLPKTLYCIALGSPERYTRGSRDLKKHPQ